MSAVMTTPSTSRVNHRVSPGHDTARMALDLAQGIKTPKEIAAEYGLTAGELKVLWHKDKQLQKQVSELRRMWNDPTNVTERVRMKAGAMVEDGLMDVWAMLTDVENNPSVRLDAHRHLAKLADVEPKREAGMEGSRFSVVINLPGDNGSDMQQLKVTAPVQEESADD